MRISFFCLIQYEGRRLKYTGDTSSVIYITFSKDVIYKEIIQLLNICQNDKHQMYALLKNAFVILDKTPVISRDTIKIISAIYL